MTTHEVEHYPPRRAQCSTIRITPYDGARIPQHHQARTHRFALPLTFAYVLRYQWTNGTTPTRTLAPFATLTAYDGRALDHPDLRAIRSLTDELGGTEVVAVEVWSTDGWTYGLMPHWRAVDPDNWPCPDERGDVRLATATVYPAYAARDWPVPGGAADLGPGTFLHWQLTADGPPPL